ncbi:hypothetical protein [Clostridium beijerinckii]|uniref:hypothetical protein n=1 Tax=Clostridium beijerinckii TaxID=1520 RepID=UPI00156F7123|nr:hypothetical protein [Clostridium beijerinckii]NRU52633.1 hypothetical protein [Clostridium beijerinckii]NYC68676.1 hypothetical protein [Clostridium beijerinckii]NYC91825.1 hypothetical protein [Clostridium beijerinckii]
MKLSDIRNEVEKYININGDKEIDNISITNDKSNIIVTRINTILIADIDVGKVGVNFYQLQNK